MKGIVNKINKFKESTFQQVMAIILILTIGGFIAFQKVPILRLYAVSWKMSWDTAFLPIDIVDEMFEVQHPHVLILMQQYFKSQAKLSDDVIEKRPDYEEEYENGTLGEYCVYMVNKYSYYELIHTEERYNWSMEFEQYRKWCDANVSRLSWDPKVKKFRDMTKPIPEDE